jgi:hypothetical protein
MRIVSDVCGIRARINILIDHNTYSQFIAEVPLSFHALGHEICTRPFQRVTGLIPTLDVLAQHLRRTHQEGGPDGVPPYRHSLQVSVFVVFPVERAVVVGDVAQDALLL